MKVKRFGPVFGLAFLLVGGGVAVAQDQEGSKGIKAEVFIGNRPAQASGRRSGARKKATYKSSQVVSSAGPPPGKVFAQVGVTIWRFRPATASDKTKELVEEEDAAPAQWSLERIPEGTLLAPGQKVRLSIESLSRDGYLYVVDREEYSDGSLGDPILIFPTRRTPEGANRVKAGKMIYIPGPPRYFRIKPSTSSKGHVAEVLTFLVSPQPLVDPNQLSATLTREQLESWEKKWATQATKFEMEGGAGQTMTEKEQKASTDDTTLTQEDPSPQTIYRLAIKPDDVLVISLPLRFTQTKGGDITNLKPR